MDPLGSEAPAFNSLLRERAVGAMALPHSSTRHIPELPVQNRVRSFSGLGAGQMIPNLSRHQSNRRIHLTRWAVTALAEKHRRQDHHPGLPGPRRPQPAGDANVRPMESTD